MRASLARIVGLGVAVVLIGREARSQEGPPPGAPSEVPAEPAQGSAPPLALDGPPLFAETAPLLPEIWRLVTARDATAKALAAGQAVLEDWLAQPSSIDPLARATAEWLRARLLTRRQKTSEAHAAWEALATTPGAFSDEARLALADLEPKSRGRGTTLRGGGAAHWLLTRSPGSPGFLEGARRAVKDLSQRKQRERAAELLESALAQGMNDPMRRELVLMRADLLPPPEAAALLLDAWWHADEAPDARVVKRLKALKALPDADATLFREALAVSRGEADAARARLKKAGGRRGPSPIQRLALALHDRWDDATCEAALASFPATPTLAGTPYPAFARGMLLRKVDRDADAVTAFLQVIEAHPDHPLADSARAQASVLLRGLDRAAEADPLDEALLAGAPPGELQRDAMWRLGFGAFLRGDAAAAERHLRALEDRYGGDPDRHSFCWFERARYWRGRVAERAGDAERAQERYASIVQRFPAGWYALLSRGRLEGRSDGRFRSATRAAPEAATWDVPREDPMATALALYRLGAEEAARDAFDALLAARQLPGNGRKLLADLWDLEGKHDKADRVLRYAAIPATMPGDDPDELYRSWYPLAHGEAVSEAARDHALPSHLLAGIVSVETRFNEKGRSKVGAIGLAQLMPSTGQAVGKKLFGDSFKASQLWDPATNLAVAAKYLQSLLERFAGHPALAVLAYNAGPAPVRRWLERRGGLELDAFVESIPFEQARRYVMRVCSDAEIYRRLYGLGGEPLVLPSTFPPIPDPPARGRAAVKGRGAPK
ncbi:MAG: lytic transglycosylase domain-containing protein [Deltaproteobacteria bacterium]|nr:lytic transglycosylase domain-containing protein [Deltaproteobacteria bacterium]